ncbi:acyl-CoA dehydrogenase family protein [Corynebacterium lowii]|uniref:Dibenzothiophene desulfurization enzyme C n=1 Tax=Corynebacterium lowii TaxID=1544413 RepID=A0A0Q0YXF6_9CORY|nr:acyl-CoA dehydrogenase family protein [Corynebacterium lowii]KQB87048.1 Dibenzothiophene desulfurization enzyme C [Corynebacterium lowii]MDP9852370.1 alkylation response protein AidB-like acyl-CoA dehydrogenase [Corynebacterium lowii]
MSAAEPAAKLAAEVAARVREGEEGVALLRSSGLLAATVPAHLGGPGWAPSEIAQALRILATADGSLAQIPQSHFVFSRWLFSQQPQRQELWARRLLAGELIANAQAEPQGPVLAHEGRLDGTKHFCTGSLHADYLAITARRPGEEAPSLGIFLPVSAPGIEIRDDWHALGQRATGSGTVVLADAPFSPADAYSFPQALALPGYGAFAQLLHTAIDVGLLSAALDETFARLRGGEHDALTFHLAGELQSRRYAAEAVLEKAGSGVDKLWAGELGAAEAALGVAAAKTLVSEVSVEVASRTYELLGARAAAANDGHDRYWRDLRTHTLHERRREKLAHLGRAYVTGQAPELGPQL